MARSPKTKASVSKSFKEKFLQSKFNFFNLKAMSKRKSNDVSLENQEVKPRRSLRKRFPVSCNLHSNLPSVSEIKSAEPSNDSTKVKKSRKKTTYKTAKGQLKINLCCVGKLSSSSPDCNVEKPPKPKAQQKGICDIKEPEILSNIVQEHNQPDSPQKLLVEEVAQVSKEVTQVSVEVEQASSEDVTQSQNLLPSCPEEPLQAVPEESCQVFEDSPKSSPKEPLQVLPEEPVDPFEDEELVVSKDLNYLVTDERPPISFWISQIERYTSALEETCIQNEQLKDKIQVATAENIQLHAAADAGVQLAEGVLQYLQLIGHRDSPNKSEI